jgi:hypothetical protein
MAGLSEQRESKALHHEVGTWGMGD